MEARSYSLHAWESPSLNKANLGQKAHGRQTSQRLQMEEEGEKRFFFHFYPERKPKEFQ